MDAAQPMEYVDSVLNDVWAYMPTLLAGLVVLVLGILAAWIVSKLVVRVLILLRLDRVLARLRLGRALQQGDVRHSVFHLVGTVLGAIVFVIFLDNAMLIWRLAVLSQLLEAFVSFIPHLAVAAVTLLVGYAVSVGVSRAVHRALYEEEFEWAQLAARAVGGAIIFGACAIALVELEVAVVLVTGAFLIVLAALSLGLALALGLGSRRAVEVMWEERFARLREEREKERDKPQEQ